MGIRRGDRVALTVDLTPAPCDKGGTGLKAAGVESLGAEGAGADRPTVGSDASLFRGPKVLIGSGIACAARKDMFRMESGLGVRMDQCLSGFAPPMNGVLDDLLFCQNVCSTVVAHVLAPRPGETVIDLCAAPGGKSTHLGALMQGRGTLVSCDRSRGKVRKMAARCRALGLFNRCHVVDSTKCVLSPVPTDGCPSAPHGAAGPDTAGLDTADYALAARAPDGHCGANAMNRKATDAASMLAKVLAEAESRGACAKIKAFPPESFDRVLLDPPCSAMGLRPRLEIDRTTLRDLEGSRDFARGFIWCAVRLLKPGGTLVFSTCTVSPMENEAQVRWMLDSFPLQLVDAEPRLGLPGLKGQGLDEEERALVQRFEPNAEADGDLDVPGFFCAKFLKTASMYA
jgi:16S rRNA C967 or C1407 C5-methylase (RsmB/RsmF family)